MEKPTVYIVVESGLVQEVYIKAPYGANTDVVLCDLDTTDMDELRTNKELQESLSDFAHKIY